jgi:hypothetical protein
VVLAADFSRALKDARQELFTRGFPIDLLDFSKGHFMTWCELHDGGCAFIVHVPGLREFEHGLTAKVDARRLLAQAAWKTAQGVVASHHAATPGMELAVGLRGAALYGPIMLGYVKAEGAGPEEGLVKYLDDSSKSNFLWAFFARSSVGRI